MNRRNSWLRGLLTGVWMPVFAFALVDAQPLPAQSPGYLPPANASNNPPQARQWATSRDAADRAPALPAQFNAPPQYPNLPQAASGPQSPTQSSTFAPAQTGAPQSMPPQYSQPQYAPPQYQAPQYQTPQYPSAPYAPPQYVVPPPGQNTNLALRQGAANSQLGTTPLGTTPLGTMSRQQPPPGGAAAAAPTLVGIWQGQSHEDGICTVMFEANGRASYSFSAGKRERSAGAFRVTGREEVAFTPDGTHVPETWSVSFDATGHLLVEMEEDNDDDEEEITLMRIK